MKSIVLLCLLFGSVAMACPNLTGKYMCDDGQGQMVEIGMTQEVVNGVTVYTSTEPAGSHSIIADGKTYSEVQKDSGVTFVIQTVAVCSGDVLNVNFTFLTKDASGNLLGSEKLDAAISLDANKNMKSEITHQEGSVETSVCNRK